MLIDQSWLCLMDERNVIMASAVRVIERQKGDVLKWRSRAEESQTLSRREIRRQKKQREMKE